MSYPLVCFFCSASLGEVPPSWISGQYFANIPTGLSSGFSLVYINSGGSQCAGICTTCEGIIDDYCLCDSDPTIQITLAGNQVNIVSNAIMAITSLEEEYRRADYELQPPPKDLIHPLTSMQEFPIPNPTPILRMLSISDKSQTGAFSSLPEVSSSPTGPTSTIGTSIPINATGSSGWGLW